MTIYPVNIDNHLFNWLTLPDNMTDFAIGHETIISSAPTILLLDKGP
jgi:hypothetical protein